MPIIGIVTKDYVSEENHDISIVYKDIEKSIIKNNGIPIGITLNYDYKRIIDICDGIIFQGGDEFLKYDFDALKYVYETNKPTLGICLGMQLMGIFFGGTMIDVSNHKSVSKYSHKVKINRNSLLYKIFNSDYIDVNSRHNSVILDTDLNISAISLHGYIEAIEDDNKKFFIGVQWHPENMTEYDDIQNRLFKYFVDVCR